MIAQIWESVKLRFIGVIQFVISSVVERSYLINSGSCYKDSGCLYAVRSLHALRLVEMTYKIKRTSDKSISKALTRVGICLGEDKTARVAPERTRLSQYT